MAPWYVLSFLLVYMDSYECKIKGPLALKKNPPKPEDSSAGFLSLRIPDSCDVTFRWKIGIFKMENNKSHRYSWGLEFPKHIYEGYHFL